MLTKLTKKELIPCLCDTLFKVIMKESPEYRNKLIALILGIDIEIVNQYTVTDSIINVVNKDQKQAQVDFLLKHNHSYINLEAYTNFNIGSLIKNYHYVSGLFWKIACKGKNYFYDSSVIQINFMESNFFSDDLISIESLPMLNVKGLDSKYVLIVNVNLAKLKNMKYTNSELEKYLKFLVCNDKEELARLASDDQVLERTRKMIENFAEDNKYLATYEKEVWDRMTYNADIEGAKNIGRQEGREKGREEGREEGRESGVQEGKTQTARAMLKDGMKPSLIAKYTGLPVTAIKNIIL